MICLLEYTVTYPVLVVILQSLGGELGDVPVAAVVLDSHVVAGVALVVPLSPLLLPAGGVAGPVV